MGDAMGDHILSEDQASRIEPSRSSHRDWRLYNVILLGFTFLLVFTAFQTCCMVQTLVLEGAKHENNDTNVGNGYTSLSIIYSVFAPCNWIAPSIIAVLGPKWSMFLGVCLYSLFIGSFLKPMAVTLYIASALVGLGAAVIWVAQGNFLALNSTDETMTRNAGIFWALFQGSLLFGNLVVFFTFSNAEFIKSHQRRITFTVLATVSVVGTLLMIAFRPSGSPESRQEERPAQPGPLMTLKRAFQLLATKEMALMCICFAYTGLEQSFWGAVFITSVGHTSEFERDAKRFTGLCGMFVGVGEIIGGVLFGFLGNCALRRRPGHDSIVLIGFIVHIVSFFALYVTMPPDSPMQESVKTSFFAPSIYITVVCGFLLGLGDASFNTQLYPVVAELFPTDSAAAFAIFKFVQSLASAATFLFSQHLELQWQLLILVVFGAVGTVLFFVVVYINSSRRRTTVYESIQSSID